MGSNPQEAVTKYAGLIEDLAKPKLADPILLRAQQSAVRMASELQINDAEDYLIAGEYRHRFTGYIKVIESICEPFVKLFHSAHRLATAHRASMLAPFIEADRILETKRIAYDAKVEAKRRADQAAAEEEARKKQKEDSDREAARLRDAGEPEAADEVEEMAALAPPPIVQVQAEELPKANTMNRTYYKWELVDASKVNPSFLCPDEKKIGDQVKSLGLKAEQIVGKGSIRIVTVAREHMRSK